MHSWNIQLQDVRRLLKRSAELELSAGAVQRLKWLQFCIEHECNVSLTCRHFGIARSTFLRWAERFDGRNPDSLEEFSRSPLTVRTSEVEAETVALIQILRTQHVNMGKNEIQKILSEKYGKEISSSTVGRVIARHKFFFGNSKSHIEKRGEKSEDEITSHSIPEMKIAEGSSSGDIVLSPFPQNPEPGFSA